MQCKLCKLPIDQYDPTAWKQVIGWVGGPKKDSMRLREDTGEYAHDLCVKQQMSGTPADQPDLFDTGTTVTKPRHPSPRYLGVDDDDGNLELF